MKQTRGFTLIELAIVLVIMTILIGGLAMPLSAQIQARRIAETQKILEEAREAIIGYAMSNTTSTCTCAYTSDVLDDSPATTCPINLCPTSVTGTATLTILPRHFLPCPDLMQNDPEDSVDNDGDGSLRDLNNGREDRYIAGPNEGECATLSGNFPWVTLGTASQDAWGNRLRYAVTAEFANKKTGFSRTDTGTLQICSTSGCAATVDVAGAVPAVLVSHGPNGWGARSIHNKMLNDPTSDDEKENTNANNNFVSRSPSRAGDAAGEFDDLVKWISADQLRGRICPAGGCS
ncbi:MAG: type II secretion system protein [Thiobacillus sp.]|nr:type II secretion system protein [Thiobacillus sp.]